MKSFIALAAVGLAAASFASSATAGGYKFSPASTRFTSPGTTSATVPTSGGPVTIQCNAVLRGSTNASGVGKTTGGSFTDGGGTNGNLCPDVTFAMLPWKLQATGRNTAENYGVDFSSPAGGCSGNLPLTLSGGVITFNGTLAASGGGTCQVSGRLTTKPTVSIVRK